MKKRLFWAISAVAVLLAYSCQQPKEDVLKAISSEDIEITAEEQAVTISFETNNAWTVSCPADWITFSAESGVAGKAEVTITVLKNDTWEYRSESVTVSSGSSRITFNVMQDYVHVYELEGASIIKVDAKSGSQIVKIKQNVGAVSCEIVEGSDWLSVAKTKAAPIEDGFELSYKSNSSIEPRIGKAVFKSDNSEIELTIEQEASQDIAVLTGVKYISNSEDTYDSDEGFGKHGEYILDFNTAIGNVRLAINADRTNAPLEGIPTGDFETALSKIHNDHTISVVGNKYYTNIVKADGTEIAISEALAEIKKDGDNYSIVFILSDIDEKLYQFSYEGSLPAIEKDIYLTHVEITRRFDYNTYFANKANETYLVLAPGRDSDDDIFLRYISFDFYNESLVDVLPVGKFEYTSELPEMIDSPYSNGTYNYLPGKIYEVYAYADYETEDGSTDYDELSVINPKLEISSNSDGTFNIKYSGDGVKAVIYERDAEGEVKYDDDWNAIVAKNLDFGAFVKSFDNVKIDPSVVLDGLRPTLDEDAEFTNLMNVQCIYFGARYTESGCNGKVYVCSFSNVNDGVYTINIPFVDDGSWEFEGNGARPTLCVTPFTAGTYTVETGYTPKPFSIAYLKAASFAATIANSYTGSRYRFTRGTVTLDSDGMATFDLYGKPSGSEKELHFTGKLSSKSSTGAIDYSTDKNSKRWPLVDWMSAPTE